MGSQNATKRREMEKAFKRQGGRCWLCGKPMKLNGHPYSRNTATADHIIPKSMGGGLVGNIKAAHRACNMKRGNKYYMIKPNCTDCGDKGYFLQAPIEMTEQEMIDALNNHAAGQPHGLIRTPCICGARPAPRINGEHHADYPRGAEEAPADFGE